MLEFDRHKRALDLEFRLQRSEALHNLERPPAERAETGRALVDLIYQGRDGRRTSHHIFLFPGQPGRFRAGDHALLSFAAADPAGAAVLEGYPVEIDSIAGERIIVFLRRGEAGEELTPGSRWILDERPPSWQPNYQRLSNALALAEYSVRPGSRLRALLQGELPLLSLGDPENPPADLAGVRAQEAFGMAMTRPLAAVQGPPGTGKTYLLARVARALLDQGLRVVLCAFTHRAINNALHALVDAGVPPAQLGKVRGGDERDLPPGITDLNRRAYWQKPPGGFLAAMTVYGAFEPYSRALGISASRTTLPYPERDGRDEQSFWDALDLYNRRVVSGARLPQPETLADVVLLDESSQLTIPMALCALACAPRVVLFGDHAQLPPVNPAAAHYDTHQSIFHLVAERYPETFVRLNETHRMNAELCTYPGEAFYASDLHPSPAARDRTFAAPDEVPAVYAPILAPHPASVLVEVRHEGQAQEAPLEALLAADLALTLLEGGLDPRRDLAILAPHRRQTSAIRTAFERLAATRGVARARLDAWLGDLLVDTVDRMQGQERDVILYSLTASDPGTLDHEGDFLFLPNRFNVAITRARRKLIVLGSPHYFRHVPRALTTAGWQGEDGALSRRRLDAVNVLKRWYLDHRDRRFDLTAHAESLASGTAKNPLRA